MNARENNNLASEVITDLTKNLGSALCNSRRRYYAGGSRRSPNRNQNDAGKFKR